MHDMRHNKTKPLFVHSRDLTRKSSNIICVHMEPVRKTNNGYRFAAVSPLGDWGVESNSILFESELALVTSPTECGRNDFLRLLRLGQKQLSSRSFCPGLSEHSLWKF